MLINHHFHPLLFSFSYNDGHWDEDEYDDGNNVMEASFDAQNERVAYNQYAITRTNEMNRFKGLLETEYSFMFQKAVAMALYRSPETREEGGGREEHILRLEPSL